MKNLSYKTAINRGLKLSAPMKWLWKNKKLEGKILDYGCGRDYDTKILKSWGADISGFDPHWKPDWELLLETYDIVTCNFVLNVLQYDSEIQGVLARLVGLAGLKGKIYVSVRNDVRNLKGWTKKETYQREVNLENFGNVVSLNKTGGYKLWQWNLS